MTKEELKRKQYDTWNKYYQKHKSEINARRKKVREGYKNKLSVAEKRIEELEKENAELKEKLGDIQMQKSDLVWKLKTANEQKAEQLTKAKEIIKYLCGMVRELNKPNVQLTNIDYSLSEAKQFISEVENDSNS